MVNTKIYTKLNMQRIAYVAFQSKALETTMKHFRKRQAGRRRCDSEIFSMSYYFVRGRFYVFVMYCLSFFLDSNRVICFDLFADEASLKSSGCQRSRTKTKMKSSALHAAKQK